MKKEWLMASLIFLLTLAVSLLLLRSLAPNLLGIPIDLQMVEVSEEVTPFFENIFRPQDEVTKSNMIKDPYTGVRGRPLLRNQGYMGPNDILGFRNRSVPGVADVIVIGDSQTYGNNSPLHQSWPGYMSDSLGKDQRATVYSMAVGGWGAVQYLYAAFNAPIFQPRVVVVAFYSGNDPLDSFKIAYGYKMWEYLIPDTSLSASDIPKVKFPPPESELWPVEFGDGVTTVFSPKLRYASNMDLPAPKAGYKIMAEVAKRVTTMAIDNKISPVFTIIPTKELVYRKKVELEGIEATESYIALVNAEEANIGTLKREIMALKGAHYVDVLLPMSSAALGSEPLYPEGLNGHPVARGYKVISDSIGPVVGRLLPKQVEGVALISLGEGKYSPVLVNESGYWKFTDSGLIEKIGWSIKGARIIDKRDLEAIDFAGEISAENVEDFRPE